MRTRMVLALSAAAAIVLGGSVAASATAPVTLGSARVLDQSDVLTTSQEESVEDHLHEVSSTTGVDLWVVYVPDFTDPTDAADWANQTARDNGLGKNQYLLAVSTEGRQFYLSGDSAGPVDEDQLDAIEQQRVGPALAADDWAGAATAAADGLADAVDGGTSFFPLLLVLVLIAIGALIVWLVVRARRRRAGPAVPGAPDRREVPQVSTEDLARQAASALVETDDAIKTSEQELGFARAQFGDEAAKEFEEALAHARQDLDRAFALRQQLDDEIPDSEEQTRAWNTQIVELCAHAGQELDEKAAAFDELRQLEQHAPEALARVQQSHAATAATQDAAATALGTLQQTYAPEALTTVAENPAHAAQLLSFADERLADAERAIAAGESAAAAVDIRAAEDAVGEAALLQTAIRKLGGDLAQGESDAAAVLADLETDIATASALPDPDGRLAGVIAATRRQTDAARAQLGTTGKRPLAALESLQKANGQIDAMLAGIRDEQAQAQRAAQQLTVLMTQAQAQVSAAEDFITSRRGAIGAEARTRLAEAGAALVQARQLQPTDPAQALGYAQRANDLAAQAIQAAQNDVGAFSGGGFGGASGGGNNVMGAVLGGILINSLLGGGGGGNRGGFGGGGFGGGGRGGGRGPGSFGGGGTRSRRGGGRF